MDCTDFPPYASTFYNEQTLDNKESLVKLHIRQAHGSTGTELRGNIILYSSAVTTVLWHLNAKTIDYTFASIPI